MPSTRKKIAVLALIPLFVGGFLLHDAAAGDGARLLSQVLLLVGDRFVDSVGTNAIYEKAARGLVKELNDPYADLYTPAQLKEFNKSTGGRYAGIGVEIEDVRGVIRVNRVFHNTPAEQGGVQEGDRVLQVDTMTTRGLQLGQVSNALLGTPGTKVRVIFGRPGVPSPIETTLTRAVVHVPAVPYTLVVNERVGYIPVQKFTENSATEVLAAIRTLGRDGVHGVILDLRGNGGGYLDQALAMSNFFLPKGASLLTVRGRGVPAETVEAEERPVLASTPLVVMIDDGTASASEIVAGALQDHDRALIVGTTSFGKGLVQSVFPLEGGYALKMTTGRWFTPSGRSIHKERALTADGRLVEVTPDSLETELVKRARPIYKSDAGRTVYGGGAITPDVIVAEDTISSAEQTFFRAVAPRSAEVYGLLTQYALELRTAVSQPEFEVAPAWRDELYRRMRAAGIEVDRKEYDAAQPSVDRLLRGRLTRIAFGDSTAKRGELKDDSQFQMALRMVDAAKTQRELFAVAERKPEQ
jgi:carboxyl-terminal processing protease